ncbi:MAG: glycosyl transferase, partial [Chloroflexales bacterium]|nr:glycosyl transferase [Chloroflexales bacterium]
TLAAANLAGWHPYELAAFNQTLGGAAAGARAFQVGWGEGYEQAAAWLNRQPDLSGVTVAAARTETLQPYLRSGAQAYAPSGDYLPPNTGYLVAYIRDTQSGEPWPPFDRFYGREPPVHVVRIHGVEYAWIYQVPPQPQRPLAATFGDALQLRGFDLAEAATPGTTLDIRLYWGVARAPQSPYAIFIHLAGADGRRYAQSDPLLSTDGWGANRYYTTPLALVLPPDLPAGAYRLIIGLYDPASGQRLALSAPQQQVIANDGPGALELALLVVR